MRKIGLLVAAAAATLAIAQPAAAAPSPLITGVAAPLCQQQGGIFYLGGSWYSCQGTMTLFDLVKAKTVCSLLFHGTLSTLPATGPSILLFPNGGYKCTFGFVGPPGD